MGGRQLLQGAGPLVLKIGGSTLDARRDGGALWRALAGVRETLHGGLVVVHGGGKAVDRLMDRLGVKPERREGLRLTPEDQIDDVVGVLAGAVNTSLVGEFCKAGMKAVGLTLGDGGLARCEKMAGLSFDPGRVGKVVGGDATLARTLLGAGFVPVVSSIGLDGDGRALNVNADDAAAGLAGVLRASGLVLLTDVPHIRGGDGRRLAELTPRDIEERIARGEIHGGMIPKARGAAGVVTEFGVPVVILSGEEPAHLMAWLAGEDVGTAVVSAGALGKEGGR